MGHKIKLIASVQWEEKLENGAFMLINLYIFFFLLTFGRDKAQHEKSLMLESHNSPLCNIDMNVSSLISFFFICFS